MSDSPIIKFPDGDSVEIVDPDNISPAFADLVTEFREVDGVVYVSFGSFIIDGDEGRGRKARVVSRLRMTKHRAAVIYGMLGNMLNGPQEDEVPKESMN